MEAYIEVSWVTFEASPWVTLPPKRKPGSAYEAAREYARLAYEAFDGEKVAQPLVHEWYLKVALVWGWLTSYGLWILIGATALGVALWRWPRLFRPLYDLLDRYRLRLARGQQPARLVLTGFSIVERICARRGLGRDAMENHAEYLARLSAHRPYLRSQFRLVAASFAAARYGASAVRREEAARTAHACDEIARLVDEVRRIATG